MSENLSWQIIGCVIVCWAAGLIAALITLVLLFRGFNFWLIVLLAVDFSCIFVSVCELKSAIAREIEEYAGEILNSVDWRDFQ